MSADYIPTFVMFPARIWNLPTITIQLLKFYEKIFQFAHKGNDVWIGNEALKEYTGMTSDSTISKAFQYFEEHGEIKRVHKMGKRYILFKAAVVIDQTLSEPNSVDNSSENSAKSDLGLATAREGSRYSEGGGLATARHNDINLNASNSNKSSCASRPEEQKKANEKKHDWAEKPKAPLAPVTSQSTCFNENYQDVPLAPMSPLLEEHMKKKEAENEADKHAARTDVQPEVSKSSHVGREGIKSAAGRAYPYPSRIRVPDRLLEACSPCSHPEEKGMAGEGGGNTALYATG